MTIEHPAGPSPCLWKSGEDCRDRGHYCLWLVRSLCVLSAGRLRGPRKYLHEPNLTNEISNMRSTCITVPLDFHALQHVWMLCNFSSKSFVCCIAPARREENIPICSPHTFAKYCVHLYQYCVHYTPSYPPRLAVHTRALLDLSWLDHVVGIMAFAQLSTSMPVTKCMSSHSFTRRESSNVSIMRNIPLGSAKLALRGSHGGYLRLLSKPSNVQQAYSRNGMVCTIFTYSSVKGFEL